VRVRARSPRARARARSPALFLLSADEKRMEADIFDFRLSRFSRVERIATWKPGFLPEGTSYLGSSSPLSEIFPRVPPVPFGVSWSFQQIMAHLIVGILSKNARDIIPSCCTLHSYRSGEHENHCRSSRHRVAEKRNIAARSGAHCLPSIVAKVNSEVVCCRNFLGPRDLTTDVR